MATDIDQAYRGWPHDQLSDQDDSQQDSVSQMLDHGSISFGRFSVDSLAWEKRSVFTYNKCQEELEKFKAPGLVAQKKAYFEEYYRRIRSMKSLQENPQTELTLDYSGDGSISSQTGEEDETAAQLESHEGEAAESGEAITEKDANKIMLEKESVCGDISEIRVLDPESTSYCGSTGKPLDVAEQEMNSSDAYDIQHPVLDSSAQDQSFEKMEQTEQYDSSRLDDSRAPRKHDILVSNVESEVATPCIEVPDVRSDVSAQGTAESSSGSQIPPQGSSLCLHSRLGDSEHTLAHGSAPEKVKVAVRNPVSKIKESAASAKGALKLETETKSLMVKSSQTKATLFNPLQTKLPLVKSLQKTPKFFLQESSIKSEKSIGSSKHSPGRVSSNKKPTLVSSCKAPTEARSNVTIPRPFSLATEKRATSSSGIRAGALRLGSKGRDRLTSSLDHVEGSTILQCTSKKQATSRVMHSKGLENKRVNEEVIKRSAVLDIKRISLDGRGASVTGPPKARSIDLPVQNKPNSTGEVKARSTDISIKVKQKEMKEHTRSRESCSEGTKSIPRPLVRNITTGSRKVNLLKTDNPSLNRSNQLVGNPKKPRKEMPRWR